MDISNNLHIAIVSSPGMGHLIPVHALANRLAATHNVRATVLLVTTAESPPESNHIFTLSLHHKLVEIVQLPPVDISYLIDSSTQVLTQICLMVREALPFIRAAVATMDHRPDALVVDLFGTETLPIAAEFNLPKFVYIPTTAWFTALTLYSPVLDREIEGDYIDELEPLKIPGCKPVRPKDIGGAMLNRNDQQYHEYVRMGKEFLLFDGILCNSWEDLEPTTLKAFRENEILRSVVKIPVYPIGPLRRLVEPDCPKTDVVNWLDRQPDESVIFVSFGSGGMLSAEQMMELAWGLELSRQRFVWVVRPPTVGRVDDAYFAVAKDSDDHDGTPYYLPDGFLARTRDVGLLVPMWAPQVEILNHPAVGGFLSHCGWNSTLESITNGVPMIAWPLYAEQKMNAAFLVEEMGVAVRLAALGREEIERAVRTLMEDQEGQMMRDKVRQLKLSAEDALKDAGTSHNSMCEVLSKIAMILNKRQTCG